VDIKTAVTLLVTVAIALCGYVYSLALARRKDELDRINRQLSDLYGPLFALSETGAYVWSSFRTTYRPYQGGYWNVKYGEVTESQAKAFRLWMEHVFMPLNKTMRDTVIANADLLEGDNMPQCLLDLCAHASAYEALHADWSSGDYSRHRPSVNFPADSLREYASAQFCRLKAEQSRLLAARRLSSRSSGPRKVRSS
jgi:hypothetical protein